MDSQKRVGVVILNWNKSGDTIRCVQSFASVLYRPMKLFVVDNASTDDSVQALRGRTSQGEVELLERSSNAGYAGGNNTGIAAALAWGADYVLIINNDTEVRNPQFLEELSEFLTRHPEVGIVGPLVRRPDGSLQDTVLFRPSLRAVVSAWVSHRRRGSAFSHRVDKHQEVEAVSGVCMLVRREVFERVGAFDTRFFMYAEEQEFAERVRRAGWRIVRAPSESIVHYGESSLSPTRWLLVRRNLVLGCRLHYGGLQAAVMAIGFLFSHFMHRWLLRPLGRNAGIAATVPVGALAKAVWQAWRVILEPVE